jgi:hypothetical protein
MPEKIPTAPSRIVICTDYSCRWVGAIGEADMVHGLAYCPVCSCACERDETCDEPIILHAGGRFDPLAATK